MSSFDPNAYPVHEALVPRGEEVFLHNATMEIPDSPLILREDAIKEWGIDGDILAIIKLPAVDGEKPKRIVVIDFGPIDTENPPAMQKNPTGKAVPFLGIATKRYALRGLQIPRSHLMAHHDIEPGDQLTLGRNSEDASYNIGLAESEPNTQAISREHFTITQNEQGIFSITDHSRHGTYIDINKFAHDVQTAGDTSLSSLVPQECEEQTRALLDAKEWQKLQPNFEHLLNLDPKDISSEMIIGIMNALKGSKVPSAGETLDVDGYGTLVLASKGEQKNGLIFVNSDGKRMHILLDDGYLLPPQIQSDPKIYARSRDFTTVGSQFEEFGTYSDARTYLSLVMRTEGDQPIGIHIQEYVGQASAKTPLAAKRAIAATRAKRYIRQHGYTLTQQSDLSKRDHYLSHPNGPIALVDVGVKRPQAQIA